MVVSAATRTKMRGRRFLSTRRFKAATTKTHQSALRVCCLSGFKRTPLFQPLVRRFKAECCSNVQNMRCELCFDVEAPQVIDGLCENV
jgi:hypothetical protein